MTLNPLFPAALLACTLALPVAAQTVTVTGTNGGTMQKNRACDRANGQAECVVDSTVTSPAGETASKQRLRTTQAGSSSTSVTTTGPQGQTGGRNRLVTWGN